ncbi:DUF1963 domain-containing protein [Lujinxingia vulgaris]|uniref:DUF1963 domain-containing protein n=1 Tax=Lujinxingia vulgaris TaxID=2600176 RepID=A0A5C6XIU2_9DELT|nr:DUF1963 domain-containing protein [Lujinxingia vulgaris]TXD39438.1 DUF1963 domain-containing protein [Lujinxingia vulgaris]
MTTARALPPTLLTHRRTAYRPRTAEGDGDLLASKFSGRPWLKADEAWPTCPNCNKPQQLFVQLNLATLPQPEQQRVGKSGLLQLFYCTSSDPLCEVECQAFFPFARSVMARRIDDPTGPTNLNASGPAEPFAPRRIESWEPIEDDVPGYEELYQMGHEISPEEEQALEEAERPATGDKLGGWPAWVQGVEYPNCPQCDAQMEVVLQIDSEDNLPYMFGDMGAGHLTCCPNHPDVLTFAWACY